MPTLLIVLLIGLLSIFVHNRIDAAYNRGFADATKSALKTNPPSDELELTCVGLWIGEQNKKAWKKEQNK